MFHLELTFCIYHKGLLWGLNSKESACQCRRHMFKPSVRKIPREGNGNHSSSLAWEIPGTEEPDGIQSTGMQRVGHN